MSPHASLAEARESLSSMVEHVKVLQDQAHFPKVGKGARRSQFRHYSNLSAHKNYSIENCEINPKLDVFRLSTGMQSNMSNDKRKTVEGQSNDVKTKENPTVFARRSIYDVPCV